MASPSGPELSPWSRARLPCLRVFGAKRKSLFNSEQDSFDNAQMIPSSSKKPCFQPTMCNNQSSHSNNSSVTHNVISYANLQTYSSPVASFHGESQSHIRIPSQPTNQKSTGDAFLVGGHDSLLHNVDIDSENNNDSQNLFPNLNKNGDSVLRNQASAPGGVIQLSSATLPVDDAMEEGVGEGDDAVRWMKASDDAWHSPKNLPKELGLQEVRSAEFESRLKMLKAKAEKLEIDLKFMRDMEVQSNDYWDIPQQTEQTMIEELEAARMAMESDFAPDPYQYGGPSMTHNPQRPVPGHDVRCYCKPNWDRGMDQSYFI